MSELTHLDETGAARMVDISDKEATLREATATGSIAMSEDAAEAIKAGSVEKGDVLAVARIAGIMAAKRTPDLIPLCHPIAITGVTVDFAWRGLRLDATATVRTNGLTGVEMEALTAISATLLTVYDMAKAIDRGMKIGGIRLLAKSGGSSGDWTA